jgi:hypothetical protein
MVIKIRIELGHLTLIALVVVFQGIADRYKR